MVFDDELYFREGALSGSIQSTDLTTDAVYIAETPVAGLGINVVIPSIASTTVDLADCGLYIEIFESDEAAGQYTLIKTMPGTDSTDGVYYLPGVYWDRVYTNKDYLKVDVTIVSVSEGSTTLDFGKVDIRLTDRFAQYAGS